MKFDVKDEQQHSDFFTPHALLNDKERNIFWAALLRPNGVAVYLAILNHAGYHSRTARPGETLLAKETGLCKRQVQREIAKLKAFNMITVTSPEEKKDLFDLSEREKVTNTYTLNDRRKWRVPEEYQQQYAKKSRTDKGKRRKTQQLDMLEDTPSILKGTTISCRDDDSQSSGGTTHSRRERRLTVVGRDDSQSSGGRLSVVPNNPIEITPQSNPTTTTTTLPPTPTPIAAQDDPVVAVAEQINMLIRRTKKGNVITPPFVAQVSREHQVTPAEILLTAHVLAEMPGITNIAGKLLGPKNRNGQHDSSCFYDGKSAFAPIQLPSSAVMSPLDVTAGSEWEQVSNILKKRINRPSFNTWIRPCVAEPIGNNGCPVKVFVPDELFVFWLGEHYYHVMQDTYETVCGRRPEIEFVVRPSDETITDQA